MKKYLGNKRNKPKPNKNSNILHSPPPPKPPNKNNIHKQKPKKTRKTKYSIKFLCTGIICKLKSNLLSATLTFSSNTCEHAMEHMANAKSLYDSDREVSQ